MNIISKKFYDVYLNYQQRQVSNLYKSEGLTDRVLEKQAKINEKDMNLICQITMKCNIKGLCNK